LKKREKEESRVILLLGLEAFFLKIVATVVRDDILARI